VRSLRGVVQGIAIVEHEYGPPVFVGDEIVHNRHVVESLTAEGAHFAEDLPETGRERSVALVGQVTGNTQVFTQVVERIRASAMPIKVIKTMCSDSYSRQREAMELVREADVVILLDDGGGAAQSVFDICSRINERVYRVRSKQEILPNWLDRARRVAVIGGILVPSWTIEDTACFVRAMA
jgi:4-hydroxy-3-methylbut-2-enyl diphosphate reductase IspH